MISQIRKRPAERHVLKAVAVFVCSGILTGSVINYLMVPLSGASPTISNHHHIRGRIHYSVLLYLATWERYIKKTISQKITKKNGNKRKRKKNRTSHFNLHV